MTNPVTDILFCKTEIKRFFSPTHAVPMKSAKRFSEDWIKGYNEYQKEYVPLLSNGNIRKDDYVYVDKLEKSRCADMLYEQVRHDGKVLYQNMIFIVTKLRGFYIKAENEYS